MSGAGSSCAQPRLSLTDLSHLSAFTSSQTLRFSRSGSVFNTPRTGEPSLSNAPSLSHASFGGASPSRLLPSSERLNVRGQLPTREETPLAVLGTSSHHAPAADVAFDAVTKAVTSAAIAVSASSHAEAGSGSAALPVWASGWAERRPLGPRPDNEGHTRPRSVSRSRPGSRNSRFPLEDALGVQSWAVTSCNASTLAGSSAPSLSNFTFASDDEPDQFAVATSGSPLRTRSTPCRQRAGCVGLTSGRDLLDVLIAQGPANLGHAGGRGCTAEPWQSQSAICFSPSGQNVEWDRMRRREGVDANPQAHAHMTPRAVTSGGTLRATSRIGHGDALRTPLSARRDEAMGRSSSAALGASKRASTPGRATTPRTSCGVQGIGRTSRLRGTGRVICGTPT